MHIKYSMERKNNSIVIIRVLAMLSIIFCHIFQELGNDLAFWLNVGVQIFVFTSGFLYGSKDITNYKEFLCKRAKKILIPYYIFLILAFIYYYIFKKEFINIKLMVTALLGLQLWGESIKGLGHLWFVPLIMICYLITPILQNLYKKMENNRSTKRLAIIGLIVFQILVLVPFINADITINITIYILGYVISRKYHSKHLTVKQLKKIFIVTCIIGIMLSILKIMLQSNLLVNLNVYILKILNIIATYKNLFIGIGVFLLIYIIGEEKVDGIKQYKIINILDKYSYDIYLTHLTFILGPSSLLYITNYMFINCCIIFVCIFISAIILNKITEKINLFLEKRKL